MATKKSSTTIKKTAPLKKTETIKKTTAKKTRVVKKEISPIAINKENIPVEKEQTKTSSVAGLREAITEAKKREVESSKPVVRKLSDVVVGREENEKKDVYTNNDFFEDSATYKKEDITKKQTLNENDPKIFSIEDNASKESAAEKAKRLIDEFNEIKKSPLDQIEKKPATPYKMPEPMVNTKRKNPMAILFAVVILVIACVSFFVFKKSSKNGNEISSNMPDSSLNVEQVGTNVSIDSTNEYGMVDGSEVITPNDSSTIPATPLTPAIETKDYTIQRGNTLAVIAKNELGDDKRWPTIFAINEKILISPDNFEPLVVIKIPREKKAVTAMDNTEKKNLYDDYMKVVDYYQKANRQKEVAFYKGKALEFYKP